MFQTLYTPEPAGLVATLTSLEWHVVFTLGGVVLTAILPALWPVPVLTAAKFFCGRTRRQPGPTRTAHRRRWSKPLVALLYLLQPIVRGWPKYAQRLRAGEPPAEAHAAARAAADSEMELGAPHTVHYWNEKGIERFAFLERLMSLLEREGWQANSDSGWDEFDVTIYGDRFTKSVIRTVAENHGGNKRLLRGQLTARWTLSGRASVWSPGPLCLPAACCGHYSYR